MNIDEFLDSVASQYVSKTPVQSKGSGVNAVPSEAFVRNVMNSKFTEQPQSYEKNATSANQKSPSASSTPVKNSQPVTGAIEQFESLSVALETSLATADYQHAFDTYIALQSALAHLHEQQKRQQREFQDKLNEFKTRLFAAVQLSTVQFQSVMQELTLQIGQIKQLVDTNQIDAATSQYTSVKQTIEQLPNNFSDKKEKLQDELLKVYLYLKDRSETHVASSFADISTDMKRLYVSAVAAIKSANMAQAQQLYEQLAAKYAQLPDGFTEQKVQLFDYVTFLHSQLTLDVANTPRASQISTTPTSTLSSSTSLINPAPQKMPASTPTFESKTQAASASSSAPSLPTSAPLPNKKTILSELKQDVKVESEQISQVKTSVLSATQTTVNSPELSQKNQEAIARLLQNVPKPESLDSRSESKSQSDDSSTQKDFRVKISPTEIGNLKSSHFNSSVQKNISPNVSVQLTNPTTQVSPKIILTQNAAQNQKSQVLQKAPLPQPSSSKQQQSTQQKTTTSQLFVPAKNASPKSASQEPLAPKNTTQNPNLQSAQQLQERAKKLAARLIELKQSLEQ